MGAEGSISCLSISLTDHSLAVPSQDTESNNRSSGNGAGLKVSVVTGSVWPNRTARGLKSCNDHTLIVLSLEPLATNLLSGSILISVISPYFV